MITLSRDMIATARRCASLLDDEAQSAIAAYVEGQWDAAGGFHGRDGRPDLYYTLFGAECLEVLDRPMPQGFSSYLRTFNEGEDLDLVHRSCLARCLALTDDGVSDSVHRTAVTQRLVDRALAEPPSVYGAFVTRLALEDLSQPVPEALAWRPTLEALQTADGGYAEQGLGQDGTTPVTAAAAVLKAGTGHDDPALADWLLARRSWMGGFHATPQAPVPDLLSTATALFALRRMGRNVADLAEDGLAFIETLWHDSGGFVGHLGDGLPDCEYTFYGLLALGALAPQTKEEHP